MNFTNFIMAVSRSAYSCSNMRLLYFLLITLLISIWCEGESICGYDAAGKELVPHMVSRTSSETRCCLPRNCTKGLRPEICTTADPEPRCTPCPEGQYNDGLIDSTDVRRRNCRDGTVCRRIDEIEISPLTRESNRQCECDRSRGFYGNPPNTLCGYRCCGPIMCGIGMELNSSGDCVSCPSGKHKNYSGFGVCVDNVEVSINSSIIVSTESYTSVATTPVIAGQAGNDETAVKIGVSIAITAAFLAALSCIFYRYKTTIRECLCCQQNYRGTELKKPADEKVSMIDVKVNENGNQDSNGVKHSNGNGDCNKGVNSKTNLPTGRVEKKSNDSCMISLISEELYTGGDTEKESNIDPGRHNPPRENLVPGFTGEDSNPVNPKKSGSPGEYPRFHNTTNSSIPPSTGLWPQHVTYNYYNGPSNIKQYYNKPASEEENIFKSSPEPDPLEKVEILNADEFEEAEAAESKCSSKNDQIV